MKIKLNLFFVLIATLLFNSCSNDEILAENFLSYQVKVIYPEAYGNAVAEGVEVNLKNVNTNRVFTALTNDTGIA